MSASLREPYRPNRNIVKFALAGGVVALSVTGLLLSYGTTDNFELFGVPTASRTLNQLTAVLLTCMALVVPLTSNLYTPKLVRLYVTHPLIVSGLLVLVGSQLLLMATTFFTPQQMVFRVLAAAVSLAYLLVLTTTLPFLYGISQFLRPSYFVPMLTRRGVQQLARLQRDGTTQPGVSRGLFETVDVLTNIALTGMNRSDRQLVLLALSALHTLLRATIADGSGDRRGWRRGRKFFVPGLAREGQDYLAREEVWPEAYVLAQMLKVMEVATKRQHEILGELASQLADTAKQAFALRRDEIVELHVMAFNTLMRDAIEEQDLRRFQNLSYHYRLLIEIFCEDPARMNGSAHHLIHYAGMAAKQGPFYALETVIYDLGEAVLSVGRRSEDAAIALIRHSTGNFLLASIAQGSQTARVGWRTLIRLYWEARAAGLERLARQLHDDYLRDRAAHREQLSRALGENRELHYEFNDRLMRFAYMSPAAVDLATRYITEGTEN